MEPEKTTVKEWLGAGPIIGMGFVGIEIQESGVLEFLGFNGGLTLALTTGFLAGWALKRASLLASTVGALVANLGCFFATYFMMDAKVGFNGAFYLVLMAPGCGLGYFMWKKLEPAITCLADEEPGEIQSSEASGEIQN